MLTILRKLYVGTPSPMFQGKVVAFRYAGKDRVVKVEKEKVLDYIQGENVLVDGQKPANKYSTYSLAKVESTEIQVIG